MDKWSTLNLSMNLLTAAFESYRELRTPEMLEARIPYVLTRVEDIVSQLKIGGPLPENFYEQRYYIMDGPRLAATLDAAFHESEGLVNFSFWLQPKEFLKRRAVKKVFPNHILPYSATHTGSKGWKEHLPGQHLLVDKRRSLVLQARLYLEKPVSFGFAIIELKYSGLDAANKALNTDRALAYQVHDILTRYIKIHNAIFRFSTLKFLLNVIFMGSILNRLQTFTAITGADFCTYERELTALHFQLRDIQATVLETSVPITASDSESHSALEEYTAALSDTIGRLGDICGHLCRKSEDVNSYRLAQYKIDMKAYEESVEQYTRLGQRLTALFRSL